MWTQSEPEPSPLCPCCGRSMLTVEVAIATPPFRVELSGCQHCGITSNEFAAPEGAAACPAGAGDEAG